MAIRNALTAISFISISILPFTSATIIDPSKVPSCVSTCTNVYQAQLLCSPPVTTADDTVCFCNSNYLANLKNGVTTGVCDGFCSSADMAQFLSYYKTICANPQVAAAAPSATATVSTKTVSSTAGTKTGTGTSTAKPVNKGTPAPKTWYAPFIDSDGKPLTYIPGFKLTMAGLYLSSY
jgi:hypothetical protein